MLLEQKYDYCVKTDTLFSISKQFIHLFRFLTGPSRRPKSLTQRAVSAVAEALTSIALYDDQQCVPKILCEVAGGSKAVSSPALLKATESLQPLLT